MVRMRGTSGEPTPRLHDDEEASRLMCRFGADSAAVASNVPVAGWPRVNYWRSTRLQLCGEMILNELVST